MSTLDRDRRGWILVFVLLILGLLCVFFAGGWALRLPSSWRLAADMGSRLSLDSGYLTRPSNPAIPPLAPSILTQPVWIEFFLTPGATIPTRVPQDTPPPAPSSPTSPAAAVSVTPSLVPPTPTNTVVFFPATQTSTSIPSPKAPTSKAPTSTPTIIPTKSPSGPADLQITKTDGTSTYAANGTLTYTITVSNLGPAHVGGAIVTDAISQQISTWNWTCTSQNNGANGCDGTSGNANFSDTVNLPAGSSIVYTVSAAVAGTAAGELANTASVALPAGYTDPNPQNNSSTDIDSPGVDLQITKTDGATTYLPGGSLTYTIVVTNNSTFPVQGAVVTDLLPVQVVSASWTCLPGAGSSCTASGIGSISDSVNLPPGSLVTYTFVAGISPFASGTLTNTASVAAPPGFVDTVPGNNSASDSNTSDSSEPGVGPPNGTWYSIPQGSSLVLLLMPAIVADGDVGTPDLVFYERLATPDYIEMDWVQVEISSDGNTWYQVLYWGDPGGAPDTNTNVDIQNLIGDLCPTEVDNCNIQPGRLYNSTGIAIDIDSLVPAKSYPWIRITSPPSDDNSEVDAIQPYYP